MASGTLKAVEGKKLKIDDGIKNGSNQTVLTTVRVNGLTAITLITTANPGGSRAGWGELRPGDHILSVDGPDGIASSVRATRNGG